MKIKDDDDDETKQIRLAVNQIKIAKKKKKCLLLLMWMLPFVKDVSENFKQTLFFFESMLLMMLNLSSKIVNTI